jgi:putative 4-mercaptohistidine N1-methyltranferase
MMFSAEVPDYETETLLSQYLFFHYGKANQQFPFSLGAADGLNFPKRCAEMALRYADAHKRASALDLGCGVGASTVALSSHFNRVLGLDFSQSFVDAANDLLKTGSRNIQVADEANVFRSFTISLPSDCEAKHISFIQGDAQCLPVEIGCFDLVLACNLLCRLPEPLRLIERLPDLLNKGGTLLITTPLTWLQHLTPESNRIGDTNQSAIEHLHQLFSNRFEFIIQADLPFLIREHLRKYQYGIAQASVWRRL